MARFVCVRQGLGHPLNLAKLHEEEHDAHKHRDELRIQKPLPHFHELLFENGSQADSSESCTATWIFHTA